MTQSALAQIESAIQEAIGPQRWEIWFKDRTAFEWDGSTLVVGTANRFVAEYIESRFVPEMLDACQQVLELRPQVRFRVDPTLFQASREQTSSSVRADKGRTAPLPAGVPRQRHSTDLPGTADWSDGVPPGRIADVSARIGDATEEEREDDVLLRRFAVGQSNQMAYAAAIALIQNPREGQGPLVFYGGVGVGKTFLLKGIEEEIRRLHPQLKSLATSCEDFCNRFSEAMKTQAQAGFRRRVRRLDLLVIDDIQFLAGKRVFQEEFLNTLNALEVRGGRVVLTANAHPQSLDRLREDLRSRMLSGMVAKMDPPNVEVRRKIIETRAIERRFLIPADVVQFLAESISGNIRTIEGAINLLHLYWDSTGNRLEVATVRELLRDVVQQTAPNISVDDVLLAACEFFGIAREELKGPGRAQAISKARMMVAYLARQHSAATYREIGKAMGDRHHSSILAGVQTIERLLAEARATVPLGSRVWNVRDAVDAFARYFVQSY